MTNKIIKKFAFSSLIYGTGTVIQKSLSILVLPFFTQILTPNDYGAIALISIVGLALSGLFSLGTGNSMGLLYFGESDPLKRGKVITTTLFLLIINCAIIISVTSFFIDNISLLLFDSLIYNKLIILSLLTTAIQVIYEPLLGYLRILNRPITFVIVTLLSAVISVTLTAIFLFEMKYGILSIILSGLISAIFTIVLLFILLFKLMPLKIDLAIIPPLVRIGFPSIFGLFAFLLIDYADRKMIADILTIDELGIYTIGYSFGMVMLVAVNAFANAWPGFYLSYINRRKEAEAIFGNIFLYYCAIFSVLVLCFFGAAEHVVDVLTEDTYSKAWQVVGIVAFAYSLKGLYLITQAGLCFERKLGWISVIDWMAAGLNIILNIIMIPIFGIVGAALATLLCYMFMPIAAYFCSKKYLNVNYHLRRIALLFGGTVTGSLYFYFNSVYFSTPSADQIYINILIIFIYCLFIYRYLINAGRVKIDE